MGLGPTFRRVTVMTANGTAQPLQTAPAWSYRFPDMNAVMEYTIDATTTAVEMQITSGSEILVERGPVPGGGTAGEFLAFQENKDQVLVYAGREIAITLFEGGGATPSVNLEVHLTPV